MAIARNGIFGPQSGKIGPVVCYMLNGQNVCRMIGRYVDAPSTDQKANRGGMSVSMEVLSPLHEVIKAGFGIEARGTVRNAFNLAVSYNKRYALQGLGEDIKIDYTKLIVSKGVLAAPTQASISKTDGGLLINWGKTCEKGAYGSDMAMIAICRSGGMGALFYQNQGKRQDGQTFIPLDEKGLNMPMEVYLFFKSVDGDRVSDSTHLGNLNGKVLTKEEQKRYEVAVPALAIAQTNFEKQQQNFIDTGKKTKAYRDVEKECRVWQRRIDELT